MKEGMEMKGLHESKCWKDKGNVVSGEQAAGVRLRILMSICVVFA